MPRRLVFGKLDQDSAGRFWVQEGDTLAFGSPTGFQIDRSHACSSTTRQDVVNVIDREAQVMDAWAALLDELGDRRSVGGRLEQFDQRTTGCVAGDAGTVGVGERDVGESEDVTEQGLQCVVVADRESDVSDGGTAARLGHGSR